MTYKEIIVRAPCRIDISSGAADWCGFSTLAMAINLYANVKIRKRKDSLVKIKIGELDEIYDPANPKFIDDELDFFKLVIDESKQKGFDLEISTEIPKRSGLGGSGSLAIAILFAINELFGLRLNRYYLAELAQRIETYRLKTIQGYQDQYAPAFGGLLLMDFKYKSSKPINEEPYAMIEQIEDYNMSLNNILIIDMGIQHDSGERNDRLSQKYLNGDKETVSLMNRLDVLSRLTKQAIVDNDKENIWKFINENQEIMEKFGRSDETHKYIIRKSIELGAKAAKCTGSGNAAIAVFCDNKEDQEILAEKLRKLEEVNEVYFVEISKGVERIEKI